MVECCDFHMFHTLIFVVLFEKQVIIPRHTFLLALLPTV